MIGSILATLGLIYDYAESHPDVVKMLADDARRLLGMAPADATNLGAMHGLAAGMAASRANAVQLAMRSRGIGDIELARKVVHDWAVTASTRNATLCQNDDVCEAMAELLRDIGRAR